MVFASVQAVRLFLRARAVINFFMRASSSLKFTNGEERALARFPASWNLSLLRRCFAPSNVVDTFKTGQQAQSYNLGQNKMRNRSTPPPNSMMYSRYNENAPFFPSLKWGEGWS